MNNEALLRQSEFSIALLESMADGVVACDENGILVLFNRAARAWHGADLMQLPKEEWAHHYDLYRADGVTPLPTEEIPLARAFRGETVVDAGMAIKAKGRAPRFILANGSAIIDAAGRRLGAVVVMRDVTSLRRAEEELRKVNEGLEQRISERTAILRETNDQLNRELEEREKIESALRMTQFAMDSAGDAVFWLRQDGAFFYANKAASALLGYTAAELLQMKAFDLNPDYRGEAWQRHWEDIKKQRILRFEIFLNTKGGLAVPVEITANYVEFEGQEYNCAFARDVTERRRNEAINASRLHLVQFSLTHSLDELLEETINEAEKLTGSVIGFYHFVDAGQRSLTLQAWSTRTKTEFCTARGKGMHYQISEAGVWVDCVHQRKPVIHNDYASLPHRKGLPTGHAPVIRELAVPVLRGDKITAILGVGNKRTEYDQRDVETMALLAEMVWDIADRKRTEEHLRQNEQFLHSVIENIPDMIFVKDAGDLRFVRFNKAGEELLGYPREQLLGRNDYDFFPKREADFFTAKDREVLAHKILVDIPEEPIQTKDKGERLLHTKKIPIVDKDGNTSYLLGISEDITERKHAEQQLAREIRNSQHMTELSRILLAADSINDIANETLKKARQATESQFGYVGYIDKATGHLICPTMTHDIWDQCGIPGKSIVFEKFGGLWGWVLKNKQPLMTNNPSTDGRSTGIPAGHIPIKSFLSVPAFYGDIMIGQIALANSSRPYCDEDLQMAERMATIFALAVRRKLAEEELLRSHEVVERIFETTTTSLAYLDRNFNFIRVNRQYAAADGKEPDFFTGKNHFALYPNEENEAIFRKVVETGETHSAYARPFEYAERPERGVSHWDWMLSPIKDSDGNVEAVMLSLIDVSEKIRAQEELRKYQAHLEGLVKERTAELEKKNNELERMNRLFVGREMRMAELKKRINVLEEDRMHNGKRS